MPQGSMVSPLLVTYTCINVFDLWIKAWRRKAAPADVIVVGYHLLRATRLVLVRCLPTKLESYLLPLANVSDI